MIFSLQQGSFRDAGSLVEDRKLTIGTVLHSGSGDRRMFWKGSELERFDWTVGGARGHSSETTVGPMEVRRGEARIRKG